MTVSSSDNTSKTDGIGRSANLVYVSSGENGFSTFSFASIQLFQHAIIDSVLVDLGRTFSPSRLIVAILLIQPSFLYGRLPCTFENLLLDRGFVLGSMRSFLLSFHRHSFYRFTRYGCTRFRCLFCSGHLVYSHCVLTHCDKADSETEFPRRNL